MIKNSWIFAFLALTACTAPPEPETAAPVDTGGCRANGTGFVHGELFGALEMQIAWPDTETDCTGMARPNEGGARLRFAKRWDDADESQLVLIIGVQDLKRGATGNGFPANVTLIDERESAFFANGGVPNCWVDIYKQNSVGEAEQYEVDGIVYCSGALASQTGQQSVRLRDLRFGGVIDWTATASGTSDWVAP